MTNIDWWLSGRPRVLQHRFEESKLIFQRRLNDLAFQSVIVLTFLPPRYRRHFLDFTYEHATIRNGSVRVGGIESGYNDMQGRQRVQRFKRQWEKGVLRSCTTFETSAQNAVPRQTTLLGMHDSVVCESHLRASESPLHSSQHRIIHLPALLA